MKTTMNAKMNGLDTQQMFETIEVLKAQPALARFEFRNKNQWIDGGHNRSMIQGFYGPGQEDSSRTEPFVFDNGEPPCLLGNNEGANPVEFLLHALAGCVTAGRGEQHFLRRAGIADRDDLDIGCLQRRLESIIRHSRRGIGQ